MKPIVLINPNTSNATTAMMTAIARKYASGIPVTGKTASRGVPMILDEAALDAAAEGVVELGRQAEAEGAAGIIVSAFGDPGLEALAHICRIPVVGICEASMLEASHGNRRFGIATVTPDLVASFAAKADALGLRHLFTGTRLTEGDPIQLTADPAMLRDALQEAARSCFEKDSAEAVIIGGGPLGEAAEHIQQNLSAPVIAPIRSAVTLLLSRLGAEQSR